MKPAPPFVLVHGAWHAASCWRLLTPLLRARGFVVHTPDLPGHGANPLPLHKVTLKAYVQALAELLDSIESRVMLVGHSMAGMVVSALVSARPEKIAQQLYLCAYLPRDGESLFDLIALNRGHEPLSAIELAMEMSADKRSCSVAGEQIVPLFYNLASTSLAQEARAAFHDQASLPLAARVNLDLAALAGVPSAYICCVRDRVIPLHHQRRMLARRSCDTLLQIDADHSPFYSCPEQLAALLAACVARV